MKMRKFLDKQLKHLLSELRSKGIDEDGDGYAKDFDFNATSKFSLYRFLTENDFGIKPTSFWAQFNGNLEAQWEIDERVFYFTFLRNNTINYVFFDKEDRVEHGNKTMKDIVAMPAMKRILK